MFPKLRGVRGRCGAGRDVGDFIWDFNRVPYLGGVYLERFIYGRHITGIVNF